MNIDIILGEDWEYVDFSNKYEYAFISYIKTIKDIR